MPTQKMPTIAANPADEAEIIDHEVGKWLDHQAHDGKENGGHDYSGDHDGRYFLSLRGRWRRWRGASGTWRWFPR
jgi:hypothetical protein